LLHAECSFFYFVPRMIFWSKVLFIFIKLPLEYVLDVDQKREPAVGMMRSSIKSFIYISRSNMKYGLLKISAVSAAIMNPAFAAFHEKSLVATPDGNRLMRELEIGNRVRSFSPRSQAMGNAMVVAKSLAEQSKSIMEIGLAGKGEIRAMPRQRVFDVGSQSWVMAKDLTSSHILFGEDGSLIDIISVEKQRRTSFSLPHDITVSSIDHTVFVDGVLCHNGAEMSAMAGSVVQKGGEMAITEGIKKGVIAVVPPPVLIAGGGMILLGVHAARQINEGNPEDFVPSNNSDYMQDILPLDMREAAAATRLPEVAVASIPKEEPKRRVNHANVDKFRAHMSAQFNAERAISVVQPSGSTGRNIDLCALGFTPYPDQCAPRKKEEPQAPDNRTKKQRAQDAKEDAKREAAENAAERARFFEQGDKIAEKRLAEKKQHAEDAKREKKELKNEHKERVDKEGQKFLEEHGMTERQFKRLPPAAQKRQKEIVTNNRETAIEKQKMADYAQKREAGKAQRRADVERAHDEMILAMFPDLSDDVHAIFNRPAAAPKPVSTPGILALPPLVGMSVATQVSAEASERRLNKQRLTNKEIVRRAEASVQAFNIKKTEGSQKSAYRNKTSQEKSALEDKLKSILAKK